MHQIFVFMNKLIIRPHTIVDHVLPVKKYNSGGPVPDVDYVIGK